MHFDENKFTAYALGELDASETGPIEARLRYDEGARQFVDDVRAAAELLTQSFVGQNDLALTELQHAVIERQLRANQAASTGLDAPELASAAIALPSPAPSMSTERLNVPRGTLRSSGGSARLASSQGERANRSIFLRRARRYDRAVLALSLAASIAIVCLGLAALLTVLKDHPTVAIVAPKATGPDTPYILQGHPTPPDQRGQHPAVATVAPPTREPTVTPPSTDEVLPWISQLPAPVQTQVGEDLALNDPQVIQLVPTPPVDLNAAPTSTVHLVRGGLVRGASDVPRPAIALTPAPKPAVPYMTSANPSPYGSLRPTIPPTQIDPSLDVTRFDAFKENPLVTTATQPFSSFAPATDSGSYVLTRRFLSHNYFPPPQVVRVEEMLNYFPWKTPAPVAPDSAFAASIEVGVCPWNVEHRLARIALKARELEPGRRPPLNLVFLIDTSAPMRAENKLPLLKKSLKLLLGQLSARDRLSIVGASQNSWFFLPPTSGDQHRTLLAAIDRLQASGPAGSAPGIEAAYYAAAAGFMPGGMNRVLIATDGAWNAALTDPSSIVKIIEEKARTQNVSLGVLAMGGTSAGTDAALRRLAAAGNGSYLPIDSLAEARKTLVDEADGSLVEIARDVSVRVEFEPAAAESYRLIGYESHLLPPADFDDAIVGGASVGAGHEMTALYEIVPSAASRRADAPERPLLTLNVHYTDPVTQSSSLLKFASSDRPLAPSKTSNDFKFAAAITEFATLLRDSAPRANVNWGTVLDLAQQGRGPDESGYRQEFIRLVERAKAIAAHG